jgi:hypothetical protein
MTRSPSWQLDHTAGVDVRSVHWLVDPMHHSSAAERHCRTGCSRRYSSLLRRTKPLNLREVANAVEGARRVNRGTLAHSSTNDAGLRNRGTADRPVHVRKPFLLTASTELISRLAIQLGRVDRHRDNSCAGEVSCPHGFNLVLITAMDEALWAWCGKHDFTRLPFSLVD